MDQILTATTSTEYEIYLTGKGNFRYNIYPEYKANRIGKPRPKWEKSVKEHLVREWNAKWVDGMEADDMLGIQQTEDTVICTIDKDLNMIKGWHYNFVKQELYYVEPEEADRFFYYQLLVGDTTDNIKGVVGIGPKKADKLLSSIPKEEWLPTIRGMYSCEEELDINATCLYIWRKPNDSWKNLIKGNDNVV